MTLTIPKDVSSAYRPRREQPDEMGRSLFQNIYRTAEQYVADIWGLSAEMCGEGLTEYSNILAFTGGRGAGKTSAMLNVKGLLESGKKLDGSSWNGVTFIALPMIDPSHLSADETIIDIVLSRMYTRFERHCTQERSVPIEVRRKVYQAFSETYQAVRAMCQSREDRHSSADPLEGLQYAAAGNSLRELMDRLVRQFLKVLTNGRPVRGCLVLCVDDVDMNIRQGYAICEELRKYLSIPNVVILFSLYMEQMNDLIRQQYSKDFSTLLKGRDSKGRDKKGRDNLDLAESVPNMAEKYLQKLIPFGRRCALPSMDLKNLSSIQVRYDGDPADMPASPLTDEILGRLYQTTGLILVKSQRQTHGFLPTTLRGIVHLLSLLRSMEPVTVIDPEREEPYTLPAEQTERLEHNLNRIARYIQEYCLSELPQSSVTVLSVLLDESSEALNQRVIRTMLHELEDLDFKDERSSFSEFLKQDIAPENITVGDVLRVMRVYAQAVHYYDGKNIRFSALFRTVYSIRILQHFFLEAGTNAALDKRKMDLFTMLGGLLYQPEGDDLIRMKQDSVDRLQQQRVEDLKASVEQQGAQAAPLVDTILLGTIHMGSQALRINRHFLPNHLRTLRLRKLEPFYAGVSREAVTGGKGNTFQYFSYSYFGCILNALRFQSDIRNQDYQLWRERHLSPLPILSADCIDGYVTGMRRASENTRKSSSYVSEAVEIGSRSLIFELLERSCTGHTVRDFLEKGLTDFPFLKKDILLDDYLLGESLMSPANDSGSLIDEKLLKEKKKSLELCLTHLENGRRRYQSVTSVQELKSRLGLTRSGEALQEPEREMLQALSKAIQDRKALLGDDSAELGSEQLQAALEDIDTQISTEINHTKEKLNAVSRQLKEMS